jgi:endoglucanase
MLKFQSIFAIFLALQFLRPLGLAGQGFLKAEGQKIVNQKGENVLLRGIGLGGWMIQEGYMLHLQKEGQQYRIRERVAALIGEEKTKLFYQAWLSNHTTRSDIDSLHAWGFNAVRLPMHYNLFTLPVQEEPVAGQNTWLPIGFALTDSLVKWCKQDSMYVILDLHAAPGGQGNDLNISDRNPLQPSLWQSEENKRKTIALWRKLAARYAREPTVGGYDILNEPNWGFEDTLNDRNGLHEQKNIPLKALLVAITIAIREVDKTHMIIIEGNGWGNNYKGMLGPWDDNMVLSFHKYWNNNDLESIQHILQIREKYQVPVWLGETGENSNLWFTQAIRLLESQNIGWSWWPLKKLGNNNPLQIPSNTGYDALVDYWNGKPGTSAPDSSTTYKSLMLLAEDSKCENNVIHRDVIDAMIRQPFDDQALPFKKNDITANGTSIQAVDYDLGINGVAYFDLDTANYRISTGKQSMGNFGGMYRNDGVDIYRDSADPAHFYVGKIEKGEWLQYTVRVLESGRYDLVLTVAAEANGSELSVLDNGQPLATNVNIESTGGNETWKSVVQKNIYLSQGIHRLRIICTKEGYHFSRFSLDLKGP